MRPNMKFITSLPGCEVLLSAHLYFCISDCPWAKMLHQPDMLIHACPELDTVGLTRGSGWVGSRNLYNLMGRVKWPNKPKNCVIFELSHIYCRSGMRPLNKSVKCFSETTVFSSSWNKPTATVADETPCGERYPFNSCPASRKATHPHTL